MSTGDRLAPQTAAGARVPGRTASKRGHTAAAIPPRMKEGPPTGVEAGEDACGGPATSRFDPGVARRATRRRLAARSSGVYDPACWGPRGPIPNGTQAVAHRVRRVGGEGMDIGPIEYIVVGFPDNKFNGEIAPGWPSSSRAAPSASSTSSSSPRTMSATSCRSSSTNSTNWWASPTSRVRSVACSVRRTSPTSAPSWSPVPRLPCSYGRTSGRHPLLPQC